jgi:HEPN domain-containing protein
LQRGVDLREHLRVLDRSYAPTRYPEAPGGIDPNRVFVAADAVDAARRADAVFAFVDALIATSPPLRRGTSRTGR